MKILVFGFSSYFTMQKMIFYFNKIRAWHRATFDTSGLEQAPLYRMGAQNRIFFSRREFDLKKKAQIHI